MIKAEQNIFTLENNLFSRKIAVDTDGLRTISVINKTTGREYVRRPDAAEFQVTLNGNVLYSYNKPDYHVLDGNLKTADALLVFENHSITSGAAGREVLELHDTEAHAEELLLASQVAERPLPHGMEMYACVHARYAQA